MMIGDSGTGKKGTTYHYYRCANAKKTHTCDKKSVSRDWIENAVIKALIEKIMNDDLKEQEQIRRPFLTREFIHFGLMKFRKLDLATQKGRQTLIDSFVNSIYFFDDYAIITCNYKYGEERITFEDIENSELGKFLEEQKNKPEQGCSDLFVSGELIGTSTEPCEWTSFKEKSVQDLILFRKKYSDVPCPGSSYSGHALAGLTASLYKHNKL